VTASASEPGTFRVREGLHLPAIPPGQAFLAWIEPSWLRLWWAPKVFIEPRPDGEYRFDWPQQGFRLQGRFIAVEANRLLKFTWRWVHAPFMPIRTVTVHFLGDGHNGTRLVVEHGFYNNNTNDRDEITEIQNGWRYLLRRLRLTLLPPIDTPPPPLGRVGIGRRSDNPGRR